MPKKTKKEKVIAEYRRKLSSVPKPFSYHITAPSPQPIAQAPTVARAVRRDLVKTIVLAGIAIAGEIVLARLIK